MAGAVERYHHASTLRTPPRGRYLRIETVNRAFCSLSTCWLIDKCPCNSSHQRIFKNASLLLSQEESDVCVRSTSNTCPARRMDREPRCRVHGARSAEPVEWPIAPLARRLSLVMRRKRSMNAFRQPADLFSFLSVKESSEGLLCLPLSFLCHLLPFSMPDSRANGKIQGAIQ